MYANYSRTATGEAGFFDRMRAIQAGQDPGSLDVALESKLATNVNMMLGVSLGAGLVGMLMGYMSVGGKK